MHLQNTSFKTSCSSFRSFFLFSRLLRCVLLKCTTRNEHLRIYVQKDTGTGFVRRIAGAQIFRNTRTLTPDKPTGYFINNDPRDAPKNVGLRRFLNCVRMINQSINQAMWRISKSCNHATLLGDTDVSILWRCNLSLASKLSSPPKTQDKSEIHYWNDRTS